MKQILLLFMLSVFIIINVMGCSVARITQTRMMEGVKKINKTDLKLDFQLDYNPSTRSLSINLTHQPYAIYKPKITYTDLGVGLAAVGIWGLVFYDNWDHDNTFDFTDDTFDWYGMEWWEWGVFIGVPVDILLYWTFAYPFDQYKKKLNSKPLIGHPYRIELPNHADIGKNYTTLTGNEEIVIKEFLSDIGNLSYLQNVDKLKFRVSMEDRGIPYRRDYIAPILDLPSPKVKINAEWVENSIRAGERAILIITVENMGETGLTDLTATTASSNRNFDHWEFNIGNIPQGSKHTRAMGFSTDAEIPTQNITVTISFKTTSGDFNQKIQKTLSIIK